MAIEYEVGPDSLIVDILTELETNEIDIIEAVDKIQSLLLQARLEAKREIAKEILDFIKDNSCNFWTEVEWTKLNIKTVLWNELRQKYCNGGGE